MFFEEHAKLLSEFARVSQAAGARADYVQGGGGNTSVKLPGGLMAIKASGFCLSDIRPDKAYAVLDGADLRNFYLTTEPSALADVEKEGSARAKANIRHIDGLADLRPSVEAGFHSILKTFVVHTHSVYANLAACSTACRPIAAQAFAGANYTWGWVPYTDPGANLTFAIRDELRRVEKETGKAPSVILMQNHGIIVHDDDPDAAQIVFKSGVPLVMCGLDVTMQAELRPADWDEMAGYGNRCGSLVRELFACAWSAVQTVGLTGVAQHDSCPVLYLAHPELFEGKMAGVFVETQAELTLGKTVTDLQSDKKFEQKNALVLLKLDREAFMQLLKDCIRTLP